VKRKYVRGYGKCTLSPAILQQVKNRGVILALSLSFSSLLSLPCLRLCCLCLCLCLCLLPFAFCLLPLPLPLPFAFCLGLGLGLDLCLCLCLGLCLGLVSYVACRIFCHVLFYTNNTVEDSSPRRDLGNLDPHTASVGHIISRMDFQEVRMGGVQREAPRKDKGGFWLVGSKIDRSSTKGRSRRSET
jgi:hypothetical protein